MTRERFLLPDFVVPCIMLSFYLALPILSLPRYSILTQAQSSPLRPSHAVPIKLPWRTAFLETGTGGKEARRRNSSSIRHYFGDVIYTGEEYIRCPMRMLHLSFLPVTSFIGTQGITPEPTQQHQQLLTHISTPPAQKDITTSTALTDPNPKSQVEPIDYRPYVQTRMSPSTTQIQSHIPDPP